MNKKSDYVIVVLFLIFMYGITLANFLIKDREFSEMENRALAQKPDFVVADILSGEYMENYESYITDQFVARDVFVGTKSLSEKLLGKKLNNHVYYGEEDYLIEQFVQADEQLLARNTEAIKKFAQMTDAKVAVAMVPGSVEINKDKLFSYLPDVSQKTIIDRIYENLADNDITCVDMYSNLKEHEEEAIYYRTDHHWTSLGAYYGYQAYAKAVGLLPAELSSYQEQVRSKEFYGTLYSKAGAFWIKPDEITTYVDEEGISVLRIEGDKTVKGALYDTDKLLGKDKYAMFLGGNQPLVHIRTKQTDMPKLLVIRDSYSDSMVPFLTEHYSEIYMWDFRYNKDSVTDFIKEENIDNVLICYSVDNFQEDTNIAFVLGRE